MPEATEAASEGIMERFERVLSPEELREKVERDLSHTRKMLSGD
ncbi:MAG: hypothetical protein SVU88_01850 [Candidatus Nanohaloarchaea archaeon]|nr:hypothetical protein [Candidatus Nanohaloarchaea archaeon]